MKNYKIETHAKKQYHLIALSQFNWMY